MDRDKAKMIRGEVERALAKVGSDHGFTFDLGRITFTDKDFSVKLRGVDNTVTAANSPMELDWDQKKFAYPELDGIVLGQRFRSPKGEVYRIAGLKPKNRKYPVIANREIDGKSFKFSPEMIAIYCRGTL